MSVILILLVASISVAGIFLFAFLWGVRSGQFEDDYSPASRILFDDKPASSPEVRRTPSESPLGLPKHNKQTGYAS